MSLNGGEDPRKVVDLSAKRKEKRATERKEKFRSPRIWGYIQVIIFLGLIAWLVQLCRF